MDDRTFSRISRHSLMHSIRNLSSTTSPDAFVQPTRFDLIFPDRNFPPTFHSLTNINIYDRGGFFILRNFVLCCAQRELQKSQTIMDENTCSRERRVLWLCLRLDRELFNYVVLYT